MTGFYILKIRIIIILVKLECPAKLIQCNPGKTNVLYFFNKWKCCLCKSLFLSFFLNLLKKYVWLGSVVVFFKNTTLLKHKSHLMKVKNIFFMWVHKKNPISSPNQTPLNKQKCIPWLIIKKLDRCSFSALKLASPATVPLIFFLY